MFDLRWIRDNPESFDAGLAKRGMGPMSSEILHLDEGWSPAGRHEVRLLARA